MRDAGRIGFDIKGEYDNAATYEFLDVVYYNYSSYVAKKETTGNPPAENNKYWQILAKGQLFGVSGVKGNKEADYRTGDVNITAENVGALPAENGLISKDLKIKGEYFPILNLVRSKYNEASAIQLTNGTEAQRGILLEGIIAAEGSESATFQIRDRIGQKVLFIVNINKRQIYDANSNSLKTILVEGDALPLSGGTLEGSVNPLVKLKRANGDFTGLQFENQYGHIFNIEGYRGEDGTDKQLNIFASDWNLSLLRINNRARVIYDYKTNYEQEIVTSNDLAFQPGDTVQVIENNMFSGCLTSSSKEIYFTIPLEKSAAGLQASINGTLRVRGVDGYLINLEDASGYDVNCFARQNIINNLLTFIVRKKDGGTFSTKNNFPVAVDGKFTITFA